MYKIIVKNKDIAFEAESKIEEFPHYMKKLKAIRHKVFKVIKPIIATAFFSAEPVPLNEIDNHKFKNIRGGHIFGAAFKCGWFRAKFSISESAALENLYLHFDIGGEGLAYCDGKIVSGLTSKLCYLDKLQIFKGKTLIPLKNLSSKNGDYEVLVDGGYNGSKLAPPYGIGVYKGCELVSIDGPLCDFYYELLNLFYIYALHEDTDEKARLKTMLNDGIILAQKNSSVEFDGFRNMLADNFTTHSKKKGFTFTAIGHSHLDLAWLWPIRETKRKSVRTFKNQLTNIEKYPFYVYGASQPQQFEWLMDKDPEIYKLVKEQVTKGRIEPQGAMWVESDTLLPSGESLIRQLYQGRKFFKEQFNKTVETCWLPDVFGYNGNLPQILKKSGIKYFMTIKLSWNQFNAFPHHTFLWEGIDGSSVISHMPPDGDYNSGGSPACFSRAYRNFKDKDVSDRALFLFGAGDGGGGAGEGHLELIKRSNVNGSNYNVEFSSAESFFNEIEKDADKLHIHRGELYFEKHQGTYTTQGAIKRANRKIEWLLHQTEYILACSYLKTGKYPESEMSDIWKEVLLYQFHDIIPGSSIGRVYRECKDRYAELFDNLRKISDTALGCFDKRDELTAFNDSPCDKSTSIVYEGKAYYFSAPAYGMGKLASIETLNEKSELSIGKNFIKNKYLTARFDFSGEIVSLEGIDGFNYAKEYLNRLTLYGDPFTMFNAWDIRIDYMKKRKIRLKAYKQEFILNDAEAVCVNSYRHGRTRITQRVSLNRDLPYVRFESNVDYHENLKMLRCDFVPSVYSDECTCDLQMGSIERKTTENNSVEYAQYEIPAHKYINLEHSGRGVAVMSDCKYGYRVKNGLISLNLIRSPLYPDIKADRGKHEFAYAFYPYRSEENDVIKHAYNLQQEPLFTSCDLPTLFTTSNKAIIIETVKKAFNGDSMTVRLYNSSKMACSTAIQTNFNYITAYECNLIEEEIKEISGKILCNIKFSGFEIKTFIFTIDRGNRNDGDNR